jgi:hypothetical protein
MSNLVGLVELEGKVALSAVLAVLVGGHEDTGTALVRWALTTETGDLAVVIDLVVLEDGELNLLVLVSDLLWGGVVLLLAFLASHTSTKAEDEMEGGLLLNVVVREGAAILELLASEDQALLIGRDS